ncbi:hypothetical protein HDU82_001299 [Entophlyctis luteolus]|nr:hypothetical protein HDU82_001299 [Entophlyctis luteolus]
MREVLNSGLYSVSFHRVKLTGISMEEAIKSLSSDGHLNVSISEKSGCSLSYKPIEDTTASSAKSTGQESFIATVTNGDCEATDSSFLYSVETTVGYTTCFNLLGNLLTESRVLYDENNKPGMFFVFYDLAVRKTGSFRLKFELYRIIDRSKDVRDGASPICATMSDVFQVYRPNDFPGLLETTELSRAFARQGVPIKMKYAV